MYISKSTGNVRNGKKVNGKEEIPENWAKTIKFCGE